MTKQPFQPVDPKADFSRIEEEVLNFWEENDCFRKSLELRKDARSFLFFDGPPFATGLPHYGHILAGTIKDVIPRYQTMLGKHVPRRFGWDCHGVPVEHEMEKQLGFKNREDIEHYGIQNFCESCRGIVLKYTKEWKQSVTRMGRWVDFENAYRTMDPDYMEGILAVFARLWNEGYIYEGKKVVAYSPKLASTLSNFEANLNYKDIDDPAVTVKFQMTNDKLQMNDETPTYFLAWTTTPWTLPSNMALCVNPNIEYAKIDKEGEHFIVAKNLAEAIFGEDASVVDTISGKDLIGTKYTPLFPFYQKLEEYDFSNAWQILGDDFVSDSDGTGIVHLAPTGEDDARILTANDIPLVYPFDPNCYFDETIPELKGKYFRYDPTVEGSKEDNANKWVINALKESGLLFELKQIRHSYPHCWRTDCALMYRGVHTFFVDIQRIKQKLLEKNEDINWIPSHIKNGRFGKILENAPDWAISRSRYWGAPIPVWKCESCDHKEVAGSIKEIGEKAKKKGKIFAVRHGEGEHNVADIVSSQVDDNVSLTEIGRKQAEATGGLLKEKEVDIVYCSPLLRARQTADILTKTAGIKTKLIIDERIKEIDAGIMDRASIPEWKQQFTKEGRFHENPHRGESQEDVEKRVLHFLREIQEKHGDKNILIVSHGAVVRTVARYFHNLSETEVFECPIETGCLHEYSFSQLPMDDFGKVDLHRPYIDKIQFDCKKCGGTMSRVPEVLDCWFESGSMPYASRWEEVKSQLQMTNDKLQSENVGAGELRMQNEELRMKNDDSDSSTVNLTADFIAEGLDQTRGWFYTLHVLGNALFGQPVFKNVIVNGIVLAEDGQKMSKSKKNYPDPQIIFDQYGADAMRFYLMNSPAVRADDLRFSEEGVLEVMRKVLLPIWNAYSFFVTYANIDKWDRELKMKNDEGGQLQMTNDKLQMENGGVRRGVSVSSKLDQWILAELGSLVKNFREKMDAYEIDAACREIPEFLDKLTNFYIRRSRRRFWKSEVDSDKNEAFTTLYTVLRTLSQVLAPISPFLPEKIWQNLKTDKEADSIHHTDFPKTEDFSQNEDLRTEISAVRTVISLALAIRAKKKIRVRQPLSLLKIALPTSVSAEMLEKNRDIILEEINAKKLLIVPDATEIAEPFAKPDARKLGPKFGKDVQHIIQEAKAGNFVKNNDGTVMVAEKWSLEPDEIEIGFVGKEGLDVESDKGIVVALDTEVTPELLEEGIAREIIRHLQEMRKAADYQISDRISVSISGADEIVKNYWGMIADEVLANDIQNRLGQPDETKEVEIEGRKIVLSVQR